MEKVDPKTYLKYFAIGLIILWVFAYLCFAFVILEFNPFNWTQWERGSYVFSMIAILVMGIPISQLIKSNFED